VAPSPVATRSARPVLRLGRDTEDDGYRAVDRATRGAEAPEEIVVPPGEIDWLLALGPGAAATEAEGLPAAVVVGDDVVLPVARIPAGADPRHRRHLGSRRAGALRAPAARAEEPVDGAVPPVVAALRIPDLTSQLRVVGHRRASLVRRARHREQRERRPADERQPQASQDVPARRPPRQLPRGLLDQPIDPAAVRGASVDHDPATPMSCSPRRRKSWIDATPRSRASKRLSRCSRVLTRPFARTTPAPSRRTA